MTYISNWQTIPIRSPLWHSRMRRKIEREVIEDAYLAGFTVKAIAQYFRTTQWRVYEKISVRDLKKRL